MAGSSGTHVTVDGRTIRLTSLDKVLYPETGTTKGDVVAYYRAVAPWFVAHSSRRPATRKRWVDGVGTAADPAIPFFSKNLDSGTPDWVATTTLEHEHRDAVYPLVDDEATLVWMAQIAALELHVPQWRVGPRGGHRNPDRLVLDLDPGEGAGLSECVQAAHLCREILDGMGLAPVPVTSGSKGIHLYAALDGRTTTAGATQVAHELARTLEADHPDLVVSEMARAARGGKVFLDWSQNNASKTTVAPYSLRGRARPYVAAPRSWDELTDDLRQLEYAEVLYRLGTLGDLAAGLLPEELRVPPQDLGDRLTTYRNRRDSAQTPEPVPEEAERTPPPQESSSFVIQEHHASRLHWDFRLEHDGVLVSWALPKGPPTDPKRNHLAIMTEDHPLEYGSFEGTIPQGQYGGGAVTIWDAGTYECEKWIDGREVIAILHGREGGGLGGTAKFALIRTGKGDDAEQWLIHRMGDPVPTERLPRIAPMLATLGTVEDVESGEWVYETKWDGFRAIAEVTGGAVTYRSRGQKDLTDAYPPLQELGWRMGTRSAVFDGEIVALDGQGRSSFGALQNIADRRTRTAAHYLIFDVLHLDGESLLRQPYRERREVLEGLRLDGPQVHVPVTFGTDRELALRTSKELRLEGLVAKTLDGVYRPGARARTWIKLKNVRTQEVIVVGWTPGSGRRSGSLGALLLAVQDEEGLAYAGKVGTGFTTTSLEDILAKVQRLERKTPALEGVPRAEARDAHWVTPKLVGEVAYAEWTSAGRLRHPTWRGWRVDKDADEVWRSDG